MKPRRSLWWAWVGGRIRLRFTRHRPPEPQPNRRILCGTCRDARGVICDICGNGLVPDDQRRIPFRRDRTVR